MQKSAYTRLPLCDGDIDHVVGLVHMKDLFTHLNLVPGKLRFTDEKTPEGEAIAIADGKPGSAVHVIGSGDIDLHGDQAAGAVRPRADPRAPAAPPVPDRARPPGGRRRRVRRDQGIVTLEDVMEEIVGEIEDEFDKEAKVEFVREGDNFRVDGAFPLHELRDKLELEDDELDAADVDTIGGYIIQELGRWPRVGDAVKLGRYTAKVMGVGPAAAARGRGADRPGRPGRAGCGGRRRGRPRRGDRDCGPRSRTTGDDRPPPTHGTAPLAPPPLRLRPRVLAAAGPAAGRRDGGRGHDLPQPAPLRPRRRAHLVQRWVSQLLGVGAGVPLAKLTQLAFVLLVAAWWRPWTPWLLALCGLLYAVAAVSNYYLLL